MGLNRVVSASAAASAAPSVLWIDDDPGSLDTSVRLLRLDGFDVEQAPSGAQGIALATARPYNLIFLDLRLPDMSGLQVLHELRSAGLSIPVSILTGFGTIDAAVEATKLGVTSFHCKPVFYEELVALARSLLEPGLQPLSDAYARQESHDALREILGLLDQAEPQSRPDKAIGRAIVLALVDPTLSTRTFGACARALRRLQPASRADTSHQSIADLRDLLENATSAVPPDWHPAVAHALAAIDQAQDGIREGPGQAIMQLDGNFVIYDAGGTDVYRSNTAGNPNAYLIVQNDGNVVIYSPGGPPLWSTGTCCY